MTEQRGDGIEAHASLDGLGGKRVSQLMGSDVADASLVREPMQHAGDPPGGDRAVAFEQQPLGT